MELKKILRNMWREMGNKDLPDEYLAAHNHNTAEQAAFKEFSYGITMVPCRMVYPYLYALATDERFSEIVKDIESDYEAYLGGIDGED